MRESSLCEEDYRLLDLRNEFSPAEAACLWLDLNPEKCVSYCDKNAPSWALEIACKSEMHPDIKARIATMYVVLVEASKGGEIEQTTPTGSQAWMAQPFIPKMSRAGLKGYAEKKGFRPKFLFPDERAAYAQGVCSTRCDWKIIDFTNWDVEEEFNFEEAAYLYYEADPAGCHGVLSGIVADEEASLFYDKSDHVSRKYQGPIPIEIWRAIVKMYKQLLRAAKTRGLYRPSKDGSNNRGPCGNPSAYPIHRDDLNYFFTEKLGQKPKFLFPKERSQQIDSRGEDRSLGDAARFLPTSEDRERSGQIKDHEDSQDSDDRFIHTPDFRSVSCNGKQYTFTSNQAYVVGILYKASQSKTPAVGMSFLLEELGTRSSRLRDTFRNHPAWRTLIVQGEKKGTYRLDL